MITKKWELGVNDRGHGHYSFAVMCEDKVLFELGVDREMAERVIMLHNRELDVEKKRVIILRGTIDD